MEPNTYRIFILLSPFLGGYFRLFFHQQELIILFLTSLNPLMPLLFLQIVRLAL